MRSRFIGGLTTDPPFMAPQSSQVLIIPALLFPQTAREVARRVDICRTGVVISKCRKDRTREIVFEHAVNASLCILGQCLGYLGCRIMRYQIASIKRPCKMLVVFSFPSSSQRTDSLQSSKPQVVWGIAHKRAIRRGRKQRAVFRKVIGVVTPTTEARRAICFGTNGVPGIEMEV